jgi:hypothetical protein
MIKFKMALSWKPRYQNNGVGWCPLLLCNGNSSYYITMTCRVILLLFYITFHYYSYSYYYYITPTAVGWCIAILHFFFTIILILILPHIFVCSISRRCFDQALWNLVGISYAMWSSALKGWYFQNGCHCHGNGQNANKLKNTKKIIAGYLPNRNW